MVTRRIAAPAPEHTPEHSGAAGSARRPAAVAVAVAVAGGLSATVETHRHPTVIRPHGSLCCTTAATLRDTVETVLATRPAAVVLDLAAVTAHDELGLWVVPALAGDAQRCGVPLTVVVPDRHLRSRLRRLGGRPVDITDTAPRPP